MTAEGVTPPAEELMETMSDMRWDFENDRTGSMTRAATQPAAPVRPPVGPTFSGASARTIAPPTFAPPTPLPQPPPASTAPAGPPSERSRAVASSAEPPRPSRWGWRAVIAFLAGGLIAGGAFTAGTWVTDDGSENAQTVTTPISTTPTTVPPTPSIELPTVENPAAFVAEKLGPSVVQIVASLGSGSGVVFRADGFILTNHHVIEGSEQVYVIDSRGRTLEGTVIGSDPRADVAVVQVPELDLPVAELALDQPLTVGQTAIAIGSPFELTRTVTAGIISSLNRPLPNADGTYTAMVQTDAPINPGNSGGPLADRNGRVIGINTAIRTDGVDRTNAGVGFAVPIDTAYRVAERILTGESLDPGFLGVGAGQTAIGEVGVVIEDITPGSGAEAAGLRSGDRVLTVDGAPVTDFFELAGLITNYFPGDEITLEVARGDRTETVTAILGDRP